MTTGAKRCVVLGGSGALGQVICHALGAAGARIAFSYFQGAETARRLEREIEGACAHALDLGDAAAIAPALDAMLAHLGGVDCLVYAAALGSTRSPSGFDGLDDVDPAGWDRLMAVNVKGAFFACRHLAPHFGDGGGNMVLVGSIDGVKSVPAPVPYAASKGALAAMVRSLAKALGDRRLCVNQVAPGVLERGISRTLPEATRAEYVKHCAMKRVGSLAEVAAVVRWLALDNSYLSGQTLVVDGGL